MERTARLLPHALVALTFLAGLAQPASAATLDICGDVDASQRVDVLDAFMVAQASVGMLTLTPAETARADVTGDSAVSVTDALNIARFAVLILDDLGCTGFGASSCSAPFTHLADFATINPTLALASGAVISGDLSVTVDIIHTDIRDLRLTLLHPDGTQVTLHNHTGPAAAGGIVGIYPTTITPSQSLTLLDGKPAGGTWTLRINDNGIGDEGTLRQWCVTIGVAPLPVSNLPYAQVSASRTGNNLIPYPYARLTGGGIPENTIQFSANLWDTGPNRVDEHGGGDDILLGPVPGGSWSTTLTATQGTIQPMTGLLTAGDRTGRGFVDYTNPTLGNTRWDVAIVPPDWIP